MKRVLIIGATSAIAIATAQRLLNAGDKVFLVGRNAHRLASVADDLRVRCNATAHTAIMDVIEYGRHETLLIEAHKLLDGIDIVLIAHGTLPSQSDCEKAFELTRNEFEINAIGTISLLTHLANYMESRRQGTIAVISSVAGDRGRQSNYVYGSAKGAITIFLQGLRNRLYNADVNVLTIKPGFIDTPMTANFDKGLLWARPEKVAVRICSAIMTGRNVVYVPPYWFLIMSIIKSIPEAIFKRLHL